jgi:hypothetical protein
MFPLRGCSFGFETGFCSGRPFKATKLLQKVRTITGKVIPTFPFGEEGIFKKAQKLKKGGISFQLREK